MATFEQSERNSLDGHDLPVILGHPTMKNLIYAALRERIVFGELKPGERLVEADLATRFQVSKTPVREALLTLEAEGLVTLRPHRGAAVSQLSPDQYRDLLFARDALEFGAASEIVAAMTPARLAEAEAHLAELVRAGDAEGLVSMLRRWHAEGLDHLAHHLARAPELTSLVEEESDDRT
jgi:DNA-binding GntR family transcriptional regulator